MSTLLLAAQIQAMKDHGGLVLNISSAYGFVPNLFDPMYATSKGRCTVLVDLSLLSFCFLKMCKQCESWFCVPLT
jgi:hypothetical protein